MTAFVSDFLVQTNDGESALFLKKLNKIKKF